MSTRWPVHGAGCSRVREFADARPNDIGAVVSLHAHTYFSRESLDEVDEYVTALPVVSQLFRREARRRLAGDAGAVDFSTGWWSPPESPRGVFESEARQAERRFGAPTFVSVTDHDRLEAVQELRRTYTARVAPLSVEWTAPWEDGYVHIGIHNLPMADVGEWGRRLAAFTAGHSRERLAELVVDLHDTPGVLVVLNHPAWDMAGLGSARHRASMTSLMASLGRFFHAIEFNGYRAAQENALAADLARSMGLPVISGGDRHGCAPNALLNITKADSFCGFVEEVRAGYSTVVVMPEYDEPLPGRMLASIADAFRTFPSHPADRRHWTDRIVCGAGGRVQPLSQAWHGRAPLWMRSVVGAIHVLAAPGMFPIVSRGFRLAGRASRGAVGVTAAPVAPAPSNARLG